MSHIPYDWATQSQLPLLESHSLAKHHVIEAYLERYLKILTADPRQDMLRLSIIDGFSGGGLYRHAETDELCRGSPLIFLETVARMEALIQAKRKKAFHIDASYFFIDSNPSAIAFLKSQLCKRGYRKLLGERIFLLNGTFVDIFHGLMEIIRARKGRALFLLDQYGYTDAPLPYIQRIFTHLPNAEVMLTFSVDALVNYIADTDRFRKCLEKLDPSRTLLSNHDIDKVEQLKKAAPASGRLAEWRLMIEKTLLHRLTKLCGAAHYTPYFITSSRSHRAYWFLHLSMHLKAWDEMLKLHWKHHNCFLHYGGAGLDMFGFKPRSKQVNDDINTNHFRFDLLAEQQSISVLMEQLPYAIHSIKDGISFYELLAQHSNHTPAHSGIFKKVLKKLQQNGDISIIDHRNGKKRRTVGHWQNHIITCL